MRPSTSFWKPAWQWTVPSPASTAWAWKSSNRCVQFSTAENEQMFGPKRAFEAKCLLNPSKVIPTLHRCAGYGKMLVRGGKMPHPDLPRF